MPMNTIDALAVAVALGSLVAIVAETTLRNPGAFKEIATDAEGFARRAKPRSTMAAAARRRGFYVAGVVATAALLFLLA
jgi:hypothetical protein